MLGAFDEHPAAVAISTFGNGALPPFGAGGIFSGDESEEAHEGARMTEAAQVSKFADDGHGGDFLESLACHERFDYGLPLPAV